MARRVVDRNGKVALRRAAQPVFNGLPWRQPVGQTDDREIMRQRRAEHRTAAARGGQPGDDLDLRLAVLAAQLIDQRGHAVDPAVAGADERHGFPALREVERHLAAPGLLRHRRGDQLLAGIAVLHQIDIDRVTGDHITRFQRPVGTNSPVFLISGADAHDKYLTQSLPPMFPPRPQWSRRFPHTSEPEAAPRPASPPVRRRCRCLSPPARREIR